MVKNLPAMQETWAQSLGWKDPLEKGKYSGLENSMDCIVHGVTKSRTRLSDFHTDGTSAVEMKNYQCRMERWQSLDSFPWIDDLDVIECIGMNKPAPKLTFIDFFFSVAFKHEECCENEESALQLLWSRHLFESTWDIFCHSVNDYLAKWGICLPLNLYSTKYTN